MAKITGYSYVPQIYRNPHTHQTTQIYIPLISIKVSYTGGQISPYIPILGRSGFFNLFRSIKFDEKGQFVYIEEF